jgi:hypothetical protein
MLKILYCILLAMLLFPEYAHAYLNPGTGSFIFQLIIAALLGGLLTLKIYWSKLKAFFKDLFSARRK